MPPPDFPAQVHSLTGGAAPDGIFLTHAHIGHYTGLMFLGREVSAASAVPVYGTARMVDFLTANGPWSMLVEAAHVALRTLTPGRSIELAPDLRVTSFLVPHRDEFTDTVGYRIDGPAGGGGLHSRRRPLGPLGSRHSGRRCGRGPRVSRRELRVVR